MTTPVIPPSALDLFRKYHMRYPSIEMGPRGLGNLLNEASRFYLQPRRGELAISNTTKLGYPFIDVNEAGLSPIARFKSGSGVNPHVQMGNAYWELIQERYFKGRRFSVRMHLPSLPSYYSTPLRELAAFPAQFGTYPAIRKGMVINSRAENDRPYLHWSAFVPEGTPEYDAISAANDLASVASRKVNKPTKQQIDELKAILFDKVKLVAA